MFRCYDGVGKDTLDGSIECLAIRGMMVSFGNASGLYHDINVPKMLQAKRLLSCQDLQCNNTYQLREELDEAAK